MARDYYAEARGLASTLAEHGYGPWSQRLTDVIAAGATGGEIVMGLRWTLGQLLETEQALPAEPRAEAESLHNGLNRLLR